MRDEDGVKHGVHARHRRRALRVHAGPAQSVPPFDLDAIVVEQDCDLVLEVLPELHEPAEPLEVLLRAIEGAPQRRPGTVLLDRRASPARLAALVHDFSAEPSLRETWISAALDEIWRHAEACRFVSLGLPPLGAVHGPLPIARALGLIEQSLWRGRPATLQNLWLQLSAAEAARLPARWARAGAGAGRETRFFC